MAQCCEDKACELTAMRARHGRVLQIVLAVNLIMFFVEAGFGWAARSTALMADSLDMLGDAMVYAASLVVIAGSQRQQARVAIFKGLLMLAFGIFVLGEAGHKAIYPVLPDAPTMGVVGLVALAANLVCFWLLSSHRDDNLNMRSVWLCSRNDLIANSGVILAAVLGYWWLSRWPDIVIGTLIAGVFLKSAWHVIRQGVIEFRQPDAG